MVGQHIFVRCRNEQNNAGTWTAAITENVVDREIVRDYIEPRCNMDETFAQRALTNVADNNVLRIYHIGEAAMVVSRTYWVTDRITETMGRKGAYSTSYILTGNDTLRFCTDFGGAFDPGCFETYDALLGRINQGKITINPGYDLFSHGEARYNPSVFKNAGFTKESFISLMNGIYFAIENKKQLAVILPQELRSAWEEKGDATAEKLAFHIMSLLPDFTRVTFGIATHWSCQVKDKMVGDMHLVFIHPKSEEEIAVLKRDQTMLLDLDGGKHTSNIPNTVSEYFGFLWDSLENKDAIEEFWSYTKSKYRKLLRGRPNSASSIEIVYLIYRITAEQFANKNALMPAFMLAASEFAGAGSKVPDAEEFIYRVMCDLKLAEASLSPEMERAICTMMKHDAEPTKHQFEEYAALLYACCRASASDETVEALCDEVLKKDRSAAPYYCSYLSEKKDIQTDAITPQLLKLVCGLFIRLSSESEMSELMRIVVDTMKLWTEKFTEKGDLESQRPIAEAYLKYISAKASNNEIRALAYGYLFEYEQKIDSARREECTSVLFKEEKRIYKSENETLDAAFTLRLYATAFLTNLQDITKLKKDTAEICFTRLFRLACKGDSEIVKLAAEAYKSTIKSAVEAEIADRVIPLILKCEEKALDEIASAGSIWSPDMVGSVLLLFEVTNMNSFNYSPSEERIASLMRWFNKSDINTYRVFAYYLKNMQIANRQRLYKSLQTGEFMSGLFLHVLFGENKPELAAEIENQLEMDHTARFVLIMTSKLLSDTSYDASETSGIFSTWYSNSLNRLIRETSFEPGKQFEAQLNVIMREYHAISSTYTENPQLKDIAKTILDKAAYEIISAANEENVCGLPGDVLREIIRLVAESSYEQKPSNMELFESVRKVDATIADRRIASLEAMCAQTRQTDKEDLVCQRIKYHILSAPDSEQAKQLWMYYYIMYAREEGAFDVSAYLSSMGYGEASTTEVGSFLTGRLNDMALKRSAFESFVGYPIMRYLYARMSQSPQSMNDGNFLHLLNNIRGRDYVRNSGMINLARQAIDSNRLRFDLPMFFKCLLGSVVTFALALLSFWLLTILCKMDMVIMLSVGIAIFILLAIVGIALLPRKSKKRPR